MSAIAYKKLEKEKRNVFGEGMLGLLKMWNY
jgi:hypothetical protein